VLEIEGRLPDLLGKSSSKVKLEDSCRQYLGITLHGKKLIYLNSFPKSILTDFPKPAAWRAKAVVVCDGGDAFWGVMYDPADNTLHDLQSNGVA
jgi:hypothetical protein